SPGEVDVVDGVLATSDGGPTVVTLIETARGLSAAEAVAAHPRVTALALGGADLAADLGAELAWEPMLWARSHLVAAAAAARAAVVEVPYLHIEDGTGLTREAEAARRLGFTGKLAIHPKQIAAINAAFAPSAEEIARARRIVDAAAAARGGVCLLDGRMIDAPVVTAARATLARARLS